MNNRTQYRRKRHARRLRQPNVSPLAVNPPMPIQRLKLVGKIAHCFTWTEKQHSSNPQAKMEHRKHALLNLRLQINQNVPASNQINPCKWRITCQIIGGKDHILSNLTFDVTNTVVLNEIAMQFRRHTFQRMAWIKTGTGNLKRLAMNISGKNFELLFGLCIGNRFRQKDRNRISFLSRGTA